MAGSKIPGPYCSVENPVGIDDGTMCRATSPPPGPVCIDSALTTELSDLAFLALNQAAKSYPPPPVTTTLLPELGSLNGRYESSGNPGAIGCDKTGGWSYGTYQLATKRGTFAGFLAFLKTTYPGFAKPLDVAGGAKDAEKGSKKFKTAWLRLATQDPIGFSQVQHEFIKATYYDVLVGKIEKNFGTDINRHSRALQNVVWSMAVQHGDGTQKVFRNALGKQNVSELSDKELIRALYAERSKVDKYFAASTNDVKASVKKRFQHEELDALKMLEEEKRQPAAPSAVLHVSLAG